MREILGRRRMNRSSPLQAALHCATRWGWPVLPGAVLNPPAAGASSSASTASTAAWSAEQ